MKKKVQKYFVRWVETHTVEVVAEDEKKAFKIALKKPAKETREEATDPIIIAA
jgi:hypothetical protein